jgi:hypothetical protein
MDTRRKGSLLGTSAHPAEAGEDGHSFTMLLLHCHLNCRRLPPRRAIVSVVPIKRPIATPGGTKGGTNIIWLDGSPSLRLRGIGIITGYRVGV